MSNFESIVSNVALIDGYEYRYLLLAAVSYLKKYHNSKVTVYVQSKGAVDELKYLLKSNEIDELKLLPDWKELASQELTAGACSDAVKDAVKIEKFLGVSYNCVRMSRRDLGLGFYLGAYNHPEQMTTKKSSYEQLLFAQNQVFKFWMDEFKDNQITLVINGQKDVEVVAKAMGIEYRYLFCTRVDNYFYWTRNTYCEFPEVKNEYEKISDIAFDPINLKKQFFLDVTHKNKYFKISRYARLFDRLRHLVLTNLYRIYKRKDKKGYLFFSTLKYAWYEFKHIKRMSYPSTKKLADVKNKKFAYYPLATEPEMSLHWMSPEYFNQLSAIASIARDLPPDAILVVKEAIYSIGKRSDEFYGLIQRMKNVVILDVREHGLDVVSAADVIVTISGTSGLEGAIMGKPVIVLGRHNYYDFVDHVFTVKQEEQLRPALLKALNKEFDLNKAKQDGARLRQAAINASFDLKEFTNLNRKEFDSEVIDNVVTGLKNSLEAQKSTVDV